MQKTLGLSVLVFASAMQLAAAETCEEKFTRLLVDGNGDTPVVITAKQKFTGAPETVNIFRSDGQGHWMTEMVTPENMQWTLVHDNVMYSSSDKGKSWSKIRDLDSEADSANAKAKLKTDAESARDVTCSDETVEGVAYETVAGTYTSSMLQGAEVRNGYWINADGWIARHTSHIKASAYEMDIEQVLKQGLEIELPTP